MKFLAPPDERKRSSARGWRHEEELPLLAPRGQEPGEAPDRRTATVHPDHHVACRYALYSGPSAARPPGQRVEVQFDSKAGAHL